MRDPKKELFGKKKPELDTPCLVVDFDLLDENLQKMQARVKTAGKALRPHAKTHKCSTLAKMQVANGAIGVCAAKVSEAEALVDAGISGVLVTGPVAGREKVNRLVSLLDRAPFLMAVVDHPDTIGLLENRLAETNRQLDVLLDIDVGQRRTGVLPAKAADLAERILSSSRLRLRGIQAYSTSPATRTANRHRARRSAMQRRYSNSCRAARSPAPSSARREPAPPGSI